MYKKTERMSELLKILSQDTFTLEGVSQETIDAMVSKGLLTKI